MKRLVAILFAFLVFSVPAIFADETCEDALEESTILLQAALDRIEELEEENQKLLDGALTDETAKQRIAELEEDNKRLRDELLGTKVLIAEANAALGESNEILQLAYDRIDKDQTEIEGLRKHIDDLINAGVEIETYHWNIMVTAGYPYSMGIAVGYNLHFFPVIGFVLGFDYNIDSNIPRINAGIKINIK
jgi:hypothetical protein